MAKKNEVVEAVTEVAEEVTEVVETPSQNIVESDVIEPDAMNNMVTVSVKRNVSKNILTGIGIAAGGAVAAYGLYELVKKGVTLLRDNRKKKKVVENEPEFPKYKYKKVESSDEEKNVDAPKARKNEKVQMGFRYNR